MLKTLATIFSYLFHPVLMTALGMFIIFNSGTSLSVLHQEVKTLTLMVLSIFTLVFPVLTIFLLYFTKAITDFRLHEQKERVLPVSVSIVLYMFTFFVMRSIPQLTGGHVVYLFCGPAIMFCILVLNNYMKPSIHMAGIGMLLGLVLVLILFLGAKIQAVFILTTLAAGLLGSSRLLLGHHKPLEILLGFSVGFVLTSVILIVYIL